MEWNVAFSLMPFRTLTDEFAIPEEKTEKPAKSKKSPER